MIRTSSKHEGQVYSPEVNYVLMFVCIAVVIGFKGGWRKGMLMVSLVLGYFFFLGVRIISFERDGPVRKHTRKK